jgi:hypothetical protein
MLRQALSYQLVVAVAFGPLFCCCTTGRLLASSTSRAPTNADIGKIASPTLLASCCAHKRPVKSRNTEPEQPDKKSDPAKPTEKCPCKENSTNPITAQAGSNANDSQLLGTLALESSGTFELAPVLSAMNGCGHDRTTRGVNASLPSKDDILFAHHNLRC